MTPAVIDLLKKLLKVWDEMGPQMVRDIMEATIKAYNEVIEEGKNG